MASTGSTGSESPVTSGDETQTSSLSPLWPVVAAKKRKTTYYARKDEAEKLNEVVDQLTRQLRELEQRHANHQVPLFVSLRTNAMLKSCIAQSRRTITSTQSIVSSYATEVDDLPLGGYIHLPKGAAERQQLIHSMRPQKMKDAVEYLLQRSQHVNLHRASRQMDNYMTDEGDHVAMHWEVACFDDHSPAQVFADVLYFVRNQEMEMAEKLGSTHFRESDFANDAIDSTQVRMVSTHKAGFEAEKNIVLYTEYFPRSELLNKPHGVFFVESVDEDDAFAYQSETRVRKDLVSAVMIMDAPTTKPDEPTKVVIVGWAHMKIHDNPRLATQEQLQELSREGIHDYFDSMARVIRERNAWRTSCKTPCH